ncbi:MAG: preprotein translocase subunit SecG [Kiritimatiellia bacterium]|jgi:preprotein translocase subunit SecG
MNILNKFTSTFCVLFFFLCISVSVKSEEGDTGLWKNEDCKNVSEAAGFFLYTSGELLKTADKERKAGSEKKSEKSYAAALFFSELSENAAKNFEVFCKK